MNRGVIGGIVVIRIIAIGLQRTVAIGCGVGGRVVDGRRVFGHVWHDSGGPGVSFK